MNEEELIEAMRALLSEGHTVSSAAAETGICRAKAHKVCAAAGLRSSPEALKAAIERRHQVLAEGNVERLAQRDAEVLAKMEALRAPGVSAQKIQGELGVSDTKALQIWDKAHPGERYMIPLPVVSKKAKRRAALAASAAAALERSKQPAPERATDPRGMVMRQYMTEQYARRAAIFQHTMRTRDLPPVQESEAEDLVAKFLSTGGRVTVAPPVACAPINNGRGF